MKRTNPNFTVTRATRLAIAFNPSHQDHKAAMEEFFHSYRYPIFATIRRKGYSVNATKDLK